MLPPAPFSQCASAASWVMSSAATAASASASLAGNCSAKRSAMRASRGCAARRETSGAITGTAVDTGSEPATLTGTTGRRSGSAAVQATPSRRAARSPISASTSTGLVWKPLKPASSSSASKPFIALAVSAMIGSVQPRRRSSRVAVWPSITGICMSIRIRSNDSSATRSSAIWPFSASLTRSPTSSSRMRTSWRFSLPSSTTSTWRSGKVQRVGSAAATAASSEASMAGGASSSIPSRSPAGSIRWKVVPCPNSLVATMSPPIARAKPRLIVSPSPVPPKRRVVEASAWTKGSKIDSSLSAGMPMPLSLTSIRYSAGSAASRRSTTRTLPRSVNLIALPTRLVRIWRRRAGSQLSVAGSGPANSSASARPFCSARSCSVRTTSAATRCGAVATDSASSRPASTFDRSRMSLIRFSRWRPLEWMISRWREASAGLRDPPRRSTSVKPRIAFIGVRISWLMLARNWLLAWFAASACSLAACSAAPRCSSSVTSWKLTTTACTRLALPIAEQLARSE